MTSRFLCGLAAAALLSACTASGSASISASPSPKASTVGSTTPTTTTTTNPMPSDMAMPVSTAGPATAATAVSITGFKFSPDNVTVKAGSSITFTNMDDAPHTVTPDTAGAFTDSGTLNKGGSKSITFPTAGTFTYHCAVHPNMKGTITVQ